MAIHVVALDRALEGLVSGATTASMHTADGGATGTDEVAGGDYARQPISWEAADGGEVDADGQITFTIPAGYTVTHLGLWDGADVWQGSIPLSTEESYGAQGTYTVLLVRVTQEDITPA